MPTTGVGFPPSTLDEAAVAALAPTTLPPEAIVHEVRSGDTLSALASRYATTVEAITELLEGIRDEKAPVERYSPAKARRQEREAIDALNEEDQ